MYTCLCLATIKEHLNGKEKYRLARADGGFGELPGCSLSIRSGGLGARTGVPKRDVQTHKEGNQSGCAHGGAHVCHGQNTASSTTQQFIHSMSQSSTFKVTDVQK